MITTPVLEVPEEIITTIVEPSAFDVEVSGAFPRAGRHCARRVGSPRPPCSPATSGEVARRRLDQPVKEGAEGS